MTLLNFAWKPPFKVGEQWFQQLTADDNETGKTMTLAMPLHTNEDKPQNDKTDHKPNQIPKE